MPMKVDVVGPDDSLWHGEASSVSVPAADGEMGIRTGHQPVLAVLKPGPVRITPASGGESVRVDVLGGFVSVDDDVVMVVVDSKDERRAEDAQAAAGH